MRHAMTAVLVLIVLAAAGCSRERGVTAAEKAAFLKMLATLPHEGEFFTEDAIAAAVPRMREPFALTPEDTAEHDLYVFIALSAGLSERAECRTYAVQQFSEIAHPAIKQVWAVRLFRAKCASPEIVRYLRAALNSEKQSRELARALGPGFDEFRRSVAEHEFGDK